MFSSRSSLPLLILGILLGSVFLFRFSSIPSSRFSYGSPPKFFSSSTFIFEFRSIISQFQLISRSNSRSRSMASSRYTSRPSGFFHLVLGLFLSLLLGMALGLGFNPDLAPEANPRYIP